MDMEKYQSRAKLSQERARLMIAELKLSGTVQENRRRKLMAEIDDIKINVREAYEAHAAHCMNQEHESETGYHPTATRGHIYFISDGKLVKIGFSKNVNKRLATLQIGSPKILTLVATIEGTQRDELQLHKKFERLRIHGEWFKYTSPIKKFVGSHRV